MPRPVSIVLNIYGAMLRTWLFIWFRVVLVLLLLLLYTLSIVFVAIDIDCAVLEGDESHLLKFIMEVLSGSTSLIHATFGTSMFNDTTVAKLYWGETDTTVHWTVVDA